MRVPVCQIALALCGGIACLAISGCGPSGVESPPEVNIAGDHRPAAESAGAESVSLAEEPSTPIGDRYADAATSDRFHPMVVLATSRGEITLRLDAENAPMTVHTFLSYVNAGHYDQTIFHYVQPGEMILGGGYAADFSESPTDEPIRNEAHNGLKNRRGTIAMARDPDVIDSARCQFFINLGDNSGFDFRGQSAEDYGYCVFGQVVSGIAVAEEIGNVKTHDQGAFVGTPVEPQRIESARQLP